MDENRNSVERFLVVRGAGAAWAIRAAQVARFTTLGQWQGPAPLRAQWSAIPSAAPQPTRCLMVFRTARGERAIHVQGTVTTSDLDAHKVCPLPPPCQPAATSQLVVSALAIDGDELLFLVVAPDDRWRES